jgi:hypothetical protein
MKRTIALLVGVVLPGGLILAQERSEERQSAAFALGVLRRDGMVLPFASYDGRNWQARWPADIRFHELPITLESIDREWWGRAEPPASMTLWADGKPRTEVKLVAPAMLSLTCGRRLGLSTNYVPAEVPPPPTEQPFPKDGLVVSGTQPIGAVETVPAGAPERKMVEQAISREFDKREDLASSQFTSWRHPVKKQDRRKIPIQVEALYRAPMDDEGWTAYYVEAVRKYEPQPEDDGCGLVTSAGGWLRIGPEGKQEAELYSQITYCDRYGQTYMLPLGLVKVRSGTYWVYQVAGYEREAYLIARPTRRTVERVLSYPAVVCPFSF